jgi:hypothetical protein
MTQITFEPYGNSGLIVLCPSCGGSWTHQRRVEAFFRQEDAATGTHTRVDRSQTTTDSCLHGNPSRRRDGVRIWIECENCDARFDLTIVQHKGQTFINDGST